MKSTEKLFSLNFIYFSLIRKYFDWFFNWIHFNDTFADIKFENKRKKFNQFWIVCSKTLSEKYLTKIDFNWKAIVFRSKKLIFSNILFAKEWRLYRKSEGQTVWHPTLSWSKSDTQWTDRPSKRCFELFFVSSYQRIWFAIQYKHYYCVQKVCLFM